MNNRLFDLTALGEVLIDFISRGKSERGFYLFEQFPGGAPANVVCAATKLGLKTAFIGAVGNDMHGLFLKNTLRELGVDINGLIETSDAFTTLAFVKVDKNGERSFSFSRKPGADTRIKSENINYETIKNSSILHVGSLSLTNQPARRATFSALRFAREHGITVSYDPNYRSMLWKSENEARRRIQSILQYTDIIKISDEEMRLITGFSDVYDASKVLLNIGVSCVLITLGSKGAFVSVREGSAFVDAVRVKAVDATGAGDAFMGGFLYKLAKSRRKLRDLNLQTAIGFAEFANKVASICVSRSGAIPAMPYLEELE